MQKTGYKGNKTEIESYNEYIMHKREVKKKKIHKSMFTNSLIWL